MLQSIPQDNRYLRLGEDTYDLPRNTQGGWVWLPLGIYLALCPTPTLVKISNLEPFLKIHMSKALGTLYNYHPATLTHTYIYAGNQM